MADIVLITGLSGAGRSAAAAVFEDLGYYVIDNLPTALLPTIADLAGQPGGEIQKLALVSGRNHEKVRQSLAKMRSDGHKVSVIFLDAATPTLVKRYDATKRKHPFAIDGRGVLEAIEYERCLLDSLRDEASLVIDTSDINVHQLKRRLTGEFAETLENDRLSVSIESFGFKNGVPLDADIVMDVRFLPNPYWVEELRGRRGLDPEVRDYVIGQADAKEFLDDLENMLAKLLPRYRAEGRAYLTVGIGCTGGHHRSVAVAEELAHRLRARGTAVNTSHRDISR